MESFNALPKSLQAFSDGWEELTTTECFKIMDVHEYYGMHFSDTIRHTYTNMANSILLALKWKGLEVSSINIFEHMLGDDILQNS